MKRTIKENTINILKAAQRFDAAFPDADFQFTGASKIGSLIKALRLSLENQDPDAQFRALIDLNEYYPEEEDKFIREQKMISALKAMRKVIEQTEH